MAAIDTTRPLSHGRLSEGRHANLITTIIAKIVAWNHTRATRNALSKLTDRELEDIGLSRGNIDSLNF